MSSCTMVSFPGHEERPGNETKTYSAYHSGMRLSPLSMMHKMLQATYSSTNFFSGPHSTLQCSTFKLFASLFSFPSLLLSLPLPPLSYIPSICLCARDMLAW